MNQTKSYTVLITDGDSRAALAITRALGKRGHKVIVGHHKERSLASSSKYSHKHITYKNPADDVMDFVTSLQEVIFKENIDILIPVTDVTTLPIMQHRTELPTSCKTPFSDFDTLMKAADKLGITNLAESIGVEAPKSTIINDPSELNKIKEHILFPIVIKPSRSRVRHEGGWIYTSVSYADNEIELQDQLSALPIQAYPVLLQERIIGPGIGVFLCCQNGNPIAAFSHKRIREKPPSGGVSVLRESIPVDPIAFESASKLLKALNWNGVAMVEFKLDNRDMRPKLMEINGRFWGSLQLAIDSGVDFPSILISTLDDTATSPVFTYETGIKSRWLWGDIDALLLRLIKPSEKLKLPPGADGRITSLMKFMKLWEKNMRYEVLSLDDIKPWLYECRCRAPLLKR